MLSFDENISQSCGPQCKGPSTRLKFYVSSVRWKIVNVTGGDIELGKSGPKDVKMANSMTGVPPHIEEPDPVRTMARFGGTTMPMPNMSNVKILQERALPSRSIEGTPAHGAVYELGVATPDRQSPNGPVNVLMRHETVTIYYADKVPFCPAVLTGVPSPVIISDCLVDSGTHDLVLLYIEHGSNGLSIIRSNAAEKRYSDQYFDF